MRLWVLLTQAGIPFEEVLVRFDSFDGESQFERSVLAVNPAGKVPVLIDTGHQPDLVIWDTPAIAEYLAERFPAMRYGRHTPRSAPARAASAPKCIRPSQRCAATAR